MEPKVIFEGDILYLVWETNADIPMELFKKAFDKGQVVNYGNYENAIEVRIFK